MKLASLGLCLHLVALGDAFRAPSSGLRRGVDLSKASPFALHSTRKYAEDWVALPVNPAAGERSRTVPFSPSGLEDLQHVRQVLRLDEVVDASAVVIPSWRHHVIQYDCLSAALEALEIPTVVSPLPDGLWAYLLQRLQVHALRRAARNGTLEETIVDALARPFAHLDLALRQHSARNHGRRVAVIASDDSAWLVRAFVNSRSAEWLAEVPLTTAVLVGGYHKSIIGELALNVFPHRPRIDGDAHGSSAAEEHGVQFYSLNGRQGGRAEEGGEAIDMEATISCLSFEEHSESCVLQEYEVEVGGWLSLLGSTSLLRLWVPRVFRA